MLVKRQSDVQYVSVPLVASIDVDQVVRQFVLLPLAKEQEQSRGFQGTEHFLRGASQQSQRDTGSALGVQPPGLGGEGANSGNVNL